MAKQTRKATQTRKQQDVGSAIEAVGHDDFEEVDEGEEEVEELKPQLEPEPGAEPDHDISEDVEQIKLSIPYYHGDVSHYTVERIYAKNLTNRQRHGLRRLMVGLQHERATVCRSPSGGSVVVGTGRGQSLSQDAVLWLLEQLGGY